MAPTENAPDMRRRASFVSNPVLATEWGGPKDFFRRFFILAFRDWRLWFCASIHL